MVLWPYNFGLMRYELHHEKAFSHAKTKAQITPAVSAQLISTFVFTTWIVQCLFFLNQHVNQSEIMSVTNSNTSSFAFPWQPVAQF